MQIYTEHTHSTGTQRRGRAGRESHNQESAKAGTAKLGLHKICLALYSTKYVTDICFISGAIILILCCSKRAGKRW